MLLDASSGHNHMEAGWSISSGGVFSVACVPKLSLWYALQKGHNDDVDMWQITLRYDHFKAAT